MSDQYVASLAPEATLARSRRRREYEAGIGPPELSLLFKKKTPPPKQQQSRTKMSMKTAPPTNTNR